MRLGPSLPTIKVAVGILLALSLITIPTLTQAINVNQVYTTTTMVYWPQRYLGPNLSSFPFTATLGGCQYAEPFDTMTLNAGQQVFGALTATGSVQFIIVIDTKYQLTNQCGGYIPSTLSFTVGDPSPLTSPSGWTVPTTGLYHVIIINSSSGDASVTVLLWTLQTVTISSTTPSYSTTPTSNNYFATTSSSSVAMPLPPQTVGQNLNLGWLTPVAIIAVLLVLGFVAYRKGVKVSVGRKK
jgi:hypothetical protein